jgi:hypothetical protein
MVQCSYLPGLVVADEVSSSGGSQRASDGKPAMMAQ